MDRVVHPEEGKGPSREERPPAQHAVPLDPARLLERCSCPACTCPSAVRKPFIWARAAVTRAMSARLNIFGATRAENRAMMVTTTIISISVTPRCTASSSRLFVASHITTSFMLVIASSMLRISAPTMIPMTRIINGSKSAVKRRIAARVSALVNFRHAREHLVQTPGFFADSQQVRSKRGELLSTAQRPGNAFTALHSLRHIRVMSPRCAYCSASLPRSQSIAPGERCSPPACSLRAQNALPPPCGALSQVRESSAGTRPNANGRRWYECTHS